MTSTTTTIEYFYDYGSPFTYLLDTQITAVADALGATLRHRPMLLGGVFKATGNSSPMLEQCKPKATYGGAHLRRVVERYGCEFAFNPHFPINTLTLMRVAQAALDSDGFADVHRALFRAVWVEGRNLGEPQEIAAVLTEAGADAEALIARAADPEVKGALRATTEEAVERGVFGAPTLLLGDEMFFGNDHVQYLVDALDAAQAGA